VTIPGSEKSTETFKKFMVQGWTMSKTAQKQMETEKNRNASN
jgi:hypothetical protein